MPTARNQIGLLLLLASAPLLAQPNRIPGPINPLRRTIMRGHVHPNADPRLDRGPLNPGRRLSSLSLLLKRTPAQQVEVEQLLDEQQDPSSPNYQKWLTPEQFADRFGASQADFDKITSWLTSAGFTIDYAGRARNWIAFSGNAAQVESAFHVEMRQYAVDGRLRYGNAAEPAIPEAIEALVALLGGLHDFPMAAPKRKFRPLGSISNFPLLTGSNGTHALTPGDLATIYNVAPLYQTGITGANQRIAVIGSSNIQLSDMQAFRSTFGLPKNDPQSILVPGSADPGFNEAEGEADLDLQWTGAIAPQATLIYINSTFFVNSAIYAVDQNVAPIISMSFGICAQVISSSPLKYADAYRSLAQQANLQGITWLVSSGDSGAAGCDYGFPPQATAGLDVNVFASVPEVTGVGGTEFNEGTGRYWSSTNGPNQASALSYIPETTWNETALGNGIAGSGGGFSPYFSKPSWQTGTGVPNDNARDVPDVALSSAANHDPFVIISGGEVGFIGGTSAATPAFAGMIALLNQYLVATGKQAKPGLANINPNLYRLAQTSPDVFHDVTLGTNIVPCKVGTKDCATGQIGYRAGPGYDMITGLGSVDAYKLITGWNATSVATTTTAVTASPASLAVTAATTLTATVRAASGTLSPGGSVTFTRSGSTLGTVSLSGSGGSSTGTLTVNGSQLSTGSNSITAAYSGGSGFSASSGSVTVTVNAPTGGATTTTLTSSAASIGVSAVATLTATVRAGSGTTSPTGTVTFSVGNATLGTGNLSGSGGSANAVLTVSGNQLASGANTIFATYNGSGGFGGSTGSATLTVTVSSTATTTSLAAGPSGISSTGNTVLTATVRPASGVLSPSGSVSFTLGNTTLGTAALSGSGGSATAAITIAGSQLAAGNNTINASYAGSSGFGASAGSVIVTVNAPVSDTSATLSANPTAITTGATTQLTFTVRALSGSTSPTGQVTFVFGNVALGTGTLSGSGGAATATLTVFGSRLAIGANTINAFYGGSGGFNASSAAVSVTVSVNTSASAVIPSVLPSPIYQQDADADGYGWFYTVRLAEIGGVATTLTAFSIDATDYTSNIAAWFGSASLPAGDDQPGGVRGRSAQRGVYGHPGVAVGEHHPAVCQRTGYVHGGRVQQCKHHRHR